MLRGWDCRKPFSGFDSNLLISRVYHLKSARREIFRGGSCQRRWDSLWQRGQEKNTDHLFLLSSNDRCFDYWWPFWRQSEVEVFFYTSNTLLSTIPSPSLTICPIPFWFSNSNGNKLCLDHYAESSLPRCAMESKQAFWVSTYCQQGTESVETLWSLRAFPGY